MSHTEAENNTTSRDSNYILFTLQVSCQSKVNSVNFPLFKHEQFSFIERICSAIKANDMMSTQLLFVQLRRTSTLEMQVHFFLNSFLNFPMHTNLLQTCTSPLRQKLSFFSPNFQDMLFCTVSVSCVCCALVCFKI